MWDDDIPVRLTQDKSTLMSFNQVFNHKALSLTKASRCQMEGQGQSGIVTTVFPKKKAGSGPVGADGGEAPMQRHRTLRHFVALFVAHFLELGQSERRCVALTNGVMEKE